LSAITVTRWSNPVQVRVRAELKRLVLPLSLAIALPAQADPAPPPEIAQIPVALLVDLGSGQTLFAHQPNLRFVPASMTKVMTAYVAFELLVHNKLRSDQLYTVGLSTAKIWNGRGTSLYLKGGERVPVDALLHGIATVSANDASVVLAEGYGGSVTIWAALMNAQASRLGMTASHFGTANGWPDKGETYVTASDLVKLSRALIARHPALYHQYFGQKQMLWNGVMQASHDPTIGQVPGADGIKTGHTGEAGFNFLGSAIRDGRRLVMVIAGAHSEEERAKASRALLEWGFSAWDSRQLFADHAPIGTAQVQGGAARQVGLEALQTLFASWPKGENAAISLKIIYKGPLIAPITKGAEVAELEIRAGNAPPSRVPLVAAASVAKAGLFDRLRNGLMSLLA